MSDENLAENPFFIAMQKGFSGLKERAAEQEWVLCVPQRVSLETSAEFSAEVLKAHVLRPSPFFKGQFQTMTGIDVELREGRLHLTLPPAPPRTPASEGEGGEAVDAAPPARATLDRESVQVISDDLAYTADYRAFRTMGIERPLVGPCVEPTEEDALQSDVGDDFSLAQWSEFIRGDARHASAVATLDGFVRDFNGRYTLVGGSVGMADARRKVTGAIDATADAVAAANPTLRCEHAVLRHGVSELALSGCYRKIFDAFVQSTEGAEHVVTSFARAVNRTRNPASLESVRSPSSSGGGGFGRGAAAAAAAAAALALEPHAREFWESQNSSLRHDLRGVDLGLAEQALRGMSRCDCPLEKMRCLTRVDERIKDCVTRHMQRSRRASRFSALSKNSQSVLANDDVLPLLVQVIVGCHGRGLEDARSGSGGRRQPASASTFTVQILANASYLDEWTKLDTESGSGRHAFELANFQAAVMYIQRVAEEAAAACAVAASSSPSSGRDTPRSSHGHGHERSRSAGANRNVLKGSGVEPRGRVGSSGSSLGSSGDWGGGGGKSKSSGVNSSARSPRSRSASSQVARRASLAAATFAMSISSDGASSPLRSLDHRRGGDDPRALLGLGSGRDGGDTDVDVDSGGSPGGWAKSVSRQPAMRMWGGRSSASASTTTTVKADATAKETDRSSSRSSISAFASRRSQISGEGSSGASGVSRAGQPARRAAPIPSTPAWMSVQDDGLGDFLSELISQDGDNSGKLRSS